MLTAVYKSTKKTDTFLYVEKRDDFTKVPSALLEMFGRPQYVMMFDLTKRTSLGTADITLVKNKLSEEGFYLQIPPPVENLLEQAEEFYYEDG